jgi:hypothetical protein
MILDEALEIADRQVENESSASVQRARLQADTRVRLAALWNKGGLRHSAGPSPGWYRRAIPRCFAAVCGDSRADPTHDGVGRGRL